MIIYGSRSTHLITEKIAESCPSCLTPDMMHVSVYERYAHIFWIPIVPVGKTGGSACGHCKQILRIKDMPTNIRLAYQSAKNKAKTPVWTFSGLIIIGIGLVMLLISNQLDKKNSAARIDAPAKGDVFEVKTADKAYSLMKVTRVDKDTIYMMFNKYQADAQSGLDKLKKEGDTAFVQTETHAFLKDNLKKMQTDGTIINVDR